MNYVIIADIWKLKFFIVNTLICYVVVNQMAESFLPSCVYKEYSSSKNIKVAESSYQVVFYQNILQDMPVEFAICNMYGIIFVLIIRLYIYNEFN